MTFTPSQSVPTVAILGFGVEGRSALTYWQHKGARITVCDANPELELPAGVEGQLGSDYLEHLDRFDVVMRTASINPNIILKATPGIKAKITTVINEFLAVSPTKNIIGITGTKGKGTTTTLIAKMLEATDKQVFVGGNIGTSPFDFLSELTPESWVVLELSSFQLYDVQHAPHVGVCLMMAPEHLDWHTDMADYVQAKAQLFSHQTPDDFAVFFADNDYSRDIAAHSPGTNIPYFAPPGAHVKDDHITINGHQICATTELKLLGRHNWQNACAATTAVWQVAPEPEAIRSVLTSFSGLEHRLEFVRETGGVKYYDDSFGTTPETATVAIQAFEQPKVVILGGSDKGASFDELAKVVAQSDIRKVILIGNTSHPKYPSVTPKIEAAFKTLGFNSYESLVKAGETTMTEIVAAAHAAAQPGDVVLLSAACASFDLFKNYKERGSAFKAAVNALA